MPRKVFRGTGITAREGIEYDAKAGESPPFENWNAAIRTAACSGRYRKRRP